MRKVIVTEFMTVDGVMEAPDQWSFQFWSDESARYKYDELFASDALLLGRVTYEGFAAAWPTMTDSEGYADRMNSLPKHVVSTTLDDVTWNNSRLIKGNVAAEVAKLKQESGQAILVFGSADLIQTLMEHDLVDEYRLMISPVVVGTGKRLFKDGGPKQVLELAATQTLPSGVTVLTYRPAAKEPEAKAPTD